MCRLATVSAMPPATSGYPHLHGDTLVFVAEDDVWTAPVDGGRAYRLTADGVPGGAAPDLAGRRAAWRGRPGASGRAEVFVADGRRRGRAAADLLGRPAPRCRRLDAGGRGARRERGRAAARRADLGVRHPGRRRHPAAPARSGPLSDLALSRRRPGGAALGHHDPRRWRGGSATAAARRASCGGTPEGAGEFVRLAAEIDGHLDAPMLVGDRHRLPRPTTRAGATSTRSTRTAPTCAATPTTAAPGAPAFYARHAAPTAPGSSTSRPGELWLLDDLDARAPPARRPARRPAHRPRAAPRSRRGEWLRPCGPDRTGRASVVSVRGTVHRLTHRDGPARTLLADPGRPGPAGRAAGRRPRGLGRRRATARTPCCVAPLDPRADDAPPLRRRVRRARPGAELARRARTARASRSPRTTAGCCCSTRRRARSASWPAAPTARSPTSRSRRTALAGLPRPGRAGPQPDRPWCGWPTARPVRGHRAPVRDADPVFTLDGKHLAFLSLRSFDPIYDEHAFDLTFPASWRPFLVPLAARTPVAVRREPGRAPGLARPTRRPEDPPALRPDRSRRGRAPRTAAAEPRRRRRTRAPPEVVVDVEGLADAGGADPGRRGPLPRDARGQGLPALVPPPGRRACSATAARAPTRSRTGPCWSATTSPAASST